MTVAAPAVIEMPPPTPVGQRPSQASDEEFAARLAASEDAESTAGAAEEGVAEHSPDAIAAVAPQGAAPVAVQLIATLTSANAAEPPAGRTDANDAMPHAPALALTGDEAKAAALNAASDAPAPVSAATPNAAPAEPLNAPPRTDVETPTQPAVGTPAAQTSYANAQAASMTAQQQASAPASANAAQATGAQANASGAATVAPPTKPSQEPLASAQADSRSSKAARLEAKADKAASAAAQAQAEAKIGPAAASVKDAAPTSAAAPELQTNSPLQSQATSPAPLPSPQHAALDASQAARAAPAGAQVAREIIRRFDGGGARFELRLDPPELGRVEVRLDVTRDHRVTAVVAAESPQALAELMRHARDLEQTLQSAGLQLSENGLSFDLRQRDRSFEPTGDDARGGAGGADDQAHEAPPLTARPLGYERWRGARVDLMV